jgi:glyoxylase-like metal-dependent hydrolase (beta-lactamase superfamily II)
LRYKNLSEYIIVFQRENTDMVKKIFLFILAVSFLSLAMVSCSSKEEQTVEEEGRSALIQPAMWWESLPRPVYATLEEIQTSQNWYEVYKLKEDTYAIYEPFQFDESISYLIIGEEKAVVIDTGTGLGDMKSLIQEITHMPVSVINTHSHWDHIGANSQFKEIACLDEPTCITTLQKGMPNARLRESITGDSVWKPLPEEIDPNEWEIPPVEPTKLLHEGDIIQLGERTLEVIHTPGHSPDSICLLDAENRILFTGDLFFPGPLYAFGEDVDLNDYTASIDKILNRIDEFDYLCSGHNDPWIKSDVLFKVKQAFHDIFDGKGNYMEDQGVRRYYFEGFDILIRADMIE